MRTLVTGGAGFIGTHLVRALVERGDEVVVLDSLEPQVHGDAQPELPAGVELIVGDVGDRDARRSRALDGAERVVHLAAAVGVGQSMYEIARYTELNTMATARFLERVVAQRPMPARLVVASSMSIYGEGEYVCEEHGRVAPGPRPEEQLLARAWETGLPDLRARAPAASARSEAKPLIPTSIYAINKRDHEEMCLVTGAAYGIPDGRPALLQRLRARARRSPTRTPASRPSSPRACSTAARRSSSRTASSRATSPTSRTSCRASCSRSSPTAAVGPRGQPRHRPPDHGRRGRRSVISAGMGLDIEPIRNQQYRAGDIRHCFADPTRARELLGFEAAAYASRTAWRELVEWLQDQEADDQVDDATQELAARGLAR